MNRGYDWRLGKVRSIATDGKVIYDTALSKFRLSDAFEHTYDPFLKLILGTLLNPLPETEIEFTDGTTTIKKSVRSSAFTVEKALTVTGFSGTENIDWETIKQVN